MEWKYTQVTVSTLPEPIEPVTFESVQRVAEGMRQRLAQEANAALLGMKIKRCDWMPPGEYFMIGESSMIYVKGDQMYDVPLPKWELRPAPHLEASEVPQGYSKAYLGGYWG